MVIFIRILTVLITLCFAYLAHDNYKFEKDHKVVEVLIVKRAWFDYDDGTQSDWTAQLSFDLDISQLETLDTGNISEMDYPIIMLSEAQFNDPNNQHGSIVEVVVPTVEQIGTVPVLNNPEDIGLIFNWIDIFLVIVPFIIGWFGIPAFWRQWHKEMKKIDKSDS